VAWRKFGNGETPESSGQKGDHLVGKYYVLFDQKYREQKQELQRQGLSEEEASKEAPIFKEAQKMLLQWEASDKETVVLWETMNSWVYSGFSQTYDRLGVDFDQLYYESDTYLLGKEVVQEGLDKGIFFTKEDGSVWIDLTPDGLDEKIVLRSDGTAVYMTQDIGTAIQRVKDYQDITGMVYTVGNEQDYHFKVLFLILNKLGYDWSKDLYHLSYGMVDLPSGKMKSREGTVVDADDLMQDMHNTAKNISEELGKIEDFTDAQKEDLFDVIGLGALKYHILKVDPRKRILFDPQESVDFQGNTGPFIQYTYARIQSILRKNTNDLQGVQIDSSISFEGIEKELIKNLNQFPETIALAANQYSPALVANYTYQLVKTFNSFYQQLSILGEEDEGKKVFRLILAHNTAEVIEDAMALLGIRVPQRM
jgi:arginyl-tRNA synthetase